jgi:TonB family protein
MNPGLNGLPVRTKYTLALTLTVLARIAFAQTLPPTIISKVDAQYPDYLRKARVEGRVELAIDLDKNGEIISKHSFRVINSPDDALTESAIQALKQYRFRPATKDGHAVAYKSAVVTFDFKVVDTPEEIERRKQQPGESDEHYYARREYESAVNLSTGLTYLSNKTQNEARLLAPQFPGYAAQQLMKSSEYVKSKLAEANARVAVAKAQMDNAETCVLIYKSTIDKRATDLTTRESEGVKACQSLNLYPPQK